MAEDHCWTLAPVLVVDNSSVLGGNGIGRKLARLLVNSARCPRSSGRPPATATTPAPAAAVIAPIRRFRRDGRALSFSVLI